MSGYSLYPLACILLYVSHKLLTFAFVRPFILKQKGDYHPYLLWYFVALYTPQLECGPDRGCADYLARHLRRGFHGVMVSTQDSESCDPSSNLGGT